MSDVVTAVLAVPWGAASAWLWLRGLRRATRAGRAAGPKGFPLRSFLAAGLVFLPALVVPIAIGGSLLGFIAGRNALILRELGGIDARR